VEGERDGARDDRRRDGEESHRVKPRLFPVLEPDLRVPVVGRGVVLGDQLFALLVAVVGLVRVEIAPRGEKSVSARLFVLVVQLPPGGR
jgi:hypothetical protein